MIEIKNRNYIYLYKILILKKKSLVISNFCSVPILQHRSLQCCQMYEFRVNNQGSVSISYIQEALNECALRLN